MTKEQAEFLVEALQDDGCQGDIIPEYSGKGMYGKTTFAVTCDSIQDMIACAVQRAMMEVPTEENVSLFDGVDFALDQLGLGYVVY